MLARISPRFPSALGSPRDEEIHKRDARRFSGIVFRFAAKRDFPPTSGAWDQMTLRSRDYDGEDFR